jgi:uncharacterized protein (UPF0147 family)
MENSRKKNLSKFTPSYRSHIWQPGQTGNPKGKPNRIHRLVKTMLTENSMDAARTLCAIVNDPKVPAKVRCHAAEAILDRVYGKPTQPIEACGKCEAIVIRLQGDAPASALPEAAEPDAGKPGAAEENRLNETGAEKRKNPHGFQPGQSGNPGGRRKYDPEVKKILVEGSLLAAETLCELIHNPRVPPGVRARAAEAILDRVYGRAVQPIVAAAVGAPVEIKLAGMLKEWAK